MKWRLLLLLLLCAVVIGIFLDKLRAVKDDANILRPFDYMQYWSAGRAILNGQNPYDGQVLYAYQKQIGTNYDDPVMMWNPPWTLPCAMGLGAIHWRYGQLIWIGINLVAVLASALLLWRSYGIGSTFPGVPIVIALLFAPTLFLLLLGQISGLLLLGIAGFLWCLQAKRYNCAGIFLALTAIKPHLLILVALVIVLQSYRERALLRSISIGVLILSIAGCTPLLWNNDVWQQYQQATGAGSAGSHHTLHDWIHPTLGYMLRSKIPTQPFWAMFIPAVVGAISALVYWWLRRMEWDWVNEMPRLVIASVLVAPYGAWGFDLVLLLVPIIHISSRVVAIELWKQVCWFTGYLVVNILALASLRFEHSMTNYWIAPTTALTYGIFLLLYTPATYTNESIVAVNS